MRGIGLYHTPSKEQRSGLAEWMQNGLKLYRLLVAAGYALLDHEGPLTKPTTRTVFEVHPHACFVTALGWIPPNKETLEGQLVRIAALQKLCAQLQVSFSGPVWPVTGIEQLRTSLGLLTWESLVDAPPNLPRFSHDELDALVGVLTAIALDKGRAHGVGDAREGTIVIPEPLASSPYRSTGARLNRTASAP